MLIDPRIWANVGRFALAYLLSKDAKIFEASRDEVLTQRKSTILKEREYDYLSTTLDLDKPYTGEKVKTNTLAAANSRMYKEVRMLIGEAGMNEMDGILEMEKMERRMENR